MKSINQIFKDNEHLMDLEPVEELIEYCKELEDKVIDRFDKIDQTVMLKQLIREIKEDCKSTMSDIENANRWPKDFQPPNLESSIKKLVKYIEDYCKDQNIWL
jgi:hypothetical protein